MADQMANMNLQDESTEPALIPLFKFDTDVTEAVTYIKGVTQTVQNMKGDGEVPDEILLGVTQCNALLNGFLKFTEPYAVDSQAVLQMKRHLKEAIVIGLKEVNYCEHLIAGRKHVVSASEAAAQPFNCGASSAILSISVLYNLNFVIY